jgi:HEAT repeat protein
MEKATKDKDAVLLQASPSSGYRENVQTEETLRVEDIRRLVEQDPDPQVRVAALDLLIRYDPSEDATQVLRNLAAGPNESLREIAVAYLALMEEAAAAAANVPQEPKN